MRPYLFVATAALLSASLAAHADTIDYTITGNGSTFTFSSSSTPTPGESTSDDFSISSVVYLNGVATSDFPVFGVTGNGYASVYINESSPAPNPDLLIAYSADPQAFTGTTSDPTLLAGQSYSFTNGGTFDNGETFQFSSVDISNPAPTPEPSSFILLGTGLFGMAGVMRRRFV